jgi:hypothetical protein
MNPYNDKLMAYEDDAEDRYDDYDGYEEDDFDTGFEGNEDSYYDEDEYYDEEVEYIPADDDDMYDSYKTTSIGRIDPNDRTLTVVVKNVTS